MRNITKDITLTVEGEKRTFRLTKPDAFSGVEILRLFLRLQDQWADRAEQRDGFCRTAQTSPSVLDFIISLASDELRSVMASCLNHVEVLLPAGPHPVHTGGDWGYPELEHDAKACFRLTLEMVSFTLSDFFGDGGKTSSLIPPASSP